MRKPLSEQITSLENTRAAKAARMEEIQTKASDEGRTKDDAEKEEFDTIKAEIGRIDVELVDLRDMEKQAKAAAIAPKGDSQPAASASRAGVITLKPTVAKGTSFARYVMALAHCKGSPMEAAAYAKQRWEHSTPEVAHVLSNYSVLKAAMTAGTTTDSDWAAPLVVYQNMASEFVELLYPATIIGRIPGLRRVPFNVSMPTQTQGATTNWVGQGAPKPVGELKFDTISLGISKAAGIIVLSEELVRSSAPSAEAIVRGDLIATMAKFLDAQFVDPSVAAVSNVSPAAVTNGITPVTASGTNYAAFVVDYKALIAD